MTLPARPKTGTLKFAVTGGAGFIGSHLVRLLLAQGHEVAVIDSVLTGRAASLPSHPRLELLQVDLAAGGPAVRRTIEGAACVFHLAGEPSVQRSLRNPLLTHANNATTTVAILEAMVEAGVKRVVYASSAAVYGNQTSLPWHPSMKVAPISPYAADKAAGEIYLEAFHRLHGIEAITLRYFNVFGEDAPVGSDYSGVIDAFREAIRTGSRPVIYGDGTQTRDFIHVDDVVAATIAAATCAEALATINVGSGRATSLLELLSIMLNISEASLEPDFQPARAGDIRHSVADVESMEQILRFRAQITLEEGLKRSLARDRALARTRQG